LFILLYTPCIAVISATYRELGTKWAIFQAVGLFILAYAIVLIVSLGVGIFIGF
jgi:Fe2+ transport system protein B